MKTKLFVALTVMSLALSGQRGLAAEKGDASAELEALLTIIKMDLKAGKKTEQDHANNLKELDALLAKHQGEKTDAVAEILLTKATLYLHVFDNTDKGVELIKQLKLDFPETKPGQHVDKMLESIAKQAEQKKIQLALVEGSKFPDFNEKDVEGKPLAVANYKGKVVLIDFWATWCGPCVAELPSVLKTYERHHPHGFEVIGISLDKEEKKLTDFTQKKNMPWQQFFDGQVWGNKLAVKYGVRSIPATYLLDGEGKIIAKNLTGEKLEEAVAKALAKK